MGIRVHKVLGFGINDLEVDDFDITDPRVDKDKYDEFQEKTWDLSMEDFIKWCEENTKDRDEFHKRLCGGEELYSTYFMDLDRVPTSNIRGIGHHVVWEPEFGIPEVMLFVPPGRFGEWFRYDDHLDYYEESIRREQGNWVMMTERPIYPESMWVRFRDPPEGMWKTQEASDKAQVLFEGDYSRLIGTWDENINPVLKDEALKHAKEDYRPAFPQALTSLLWYFRDMFDDVESFANQLRPMIYTYWG
jgi:hypothetical protein